MKKPIQFQGVSYTIPYSDTILQDISFDVEEGQFIGILGQNGTGKTTLLDIMLGLKEVKGKVHILGEDPYSLHRSQKGKVVFISQDIVIKGSLSIGDFLKFHSGFYPDYSFEEEAHLLKVFGLKKEMKVGALSTGQQKKVQIVAALSTRPKLILIDEITAVLDPATRETFFLELEKTRKKYNSAIVLATNIAEDLVGRVEKIFFINEKQGKMFEPSKISELFNLGRSA